MNAETAHRLAVENDQDHYFDPVTGLMVMTSLHHLRRGHCCGNSCRHCPYGEPSTPEP